MKELNRWHIIYSRKSKYTGKGESVENQVDLCKQKLLAKYPDLKEEDIKVFTDEGFTGANTNRPDFQKMMNLIRENKVASVTCYRLDRVSRNVGDFCNLINELQAFNVGFVSIREDFDTTSPMGKAMMLICSVFAQLERDTIAERIRDNMMELAKTGRWLGGTPPTGFKSQEVQNLSIDGKKKKLFKLKELPEEKLIVNLLKDKYLEIKSQTGLETYTIQNNIKTKNGRIFTRWSLVNILSNPVYSMADSDAYDYFTEKGALVVGDKKDYNGKFGLMVYNKTNQITKKGRNDNPISEWIVAIGKHKGFWTGKEYVEVQNLLASGANKRFRKPAVNNALLSGILKCSYCGSFMRPKLYQSEVDGELRFSYLCELKDKSRRTKCDHKNLNGNEADKKVVEVIKSLAILKEEFYQALKDLASGKLNKLDTKSNELYTLTKKIKNNEKDIASLIDKIKIVPANIVPDLAKEIQKLKSANVELEEQVKKLNIDKTSIIDDTENVKIVFDIIDSYFNKFNELDLLQKRTLIKLVISSAYSDGENLILNLTGTRESAKMTEFPLGDNCK